MSYLYSGEYAEHVRWMDEEYVYNLTILAIESASVVACNRMYRDYIFARGISAYHKLTGEKFGDVRVDGLPETWLEEEPLSSCATLLEYLSNYGFAVVHLKKTPSGRVYGMNVLHPLACNVICKRPVKGELRYCCTAKGDPKAPYPDDHDPDLRIFFVQHFDVDSGPKARPRGLLSACMQEYIDSKILLRNEKITGIQNANPVVIYHEPSSSHPDTQYTHPLTDERAGNLGNGIINTTSIDERPVHGGPSGLDLLVAREQVLTRIFEQDNQMMSRAPPPRGIAVDMPGIDSRLRVTDPKPPVFSQISAPPGKVPMQVKFSPFRPDLLDLILYFNRRIYNNFQLPFSTVEDRTGNYTEALEGDELLIWRACSSFMRRINIILRWFSSEMFDKRAREVLLEYAQTEEDENLVEEIIEKDGLYLMVNPPIDLREAKLKYDDFVMSDLAYKTLLVRAGKMSWDMFQEGDGRLILAELEIGPTKPEDGTTKNTRGFTSSVLKRAASTPAKRRKRDAYDK